MRGAYSGKDIREPAAKPDSTELPVRVPTPTSVPVLPAPIPTPSPIPVPVPSPVASTSQEDAPVDLDQKYKPTRCARVLALILA